jgi:hypothetical protein
MIKLIKLLNEMGPGDLHYKYIVDFYEKGDDEIKAKIAAAIKQISGNKHKKTTIDTIKADLSGLDRDEIEEIETLLNIDPLKIDEAFFIGEGQDIKCEKCGWEWNTEDSDESDKYICHKCGYDNSDEIDEAFYEPHDPDSEETALGNMSDWNKKSMKGDIDEYDVENVDDMKEFLQFMKEYKQSLAEAQCDCVYEAEYHGHSVSLGKPMQGDIKKFKVYVKNPKGKVVKVNFGAHGMNIKKNNPKRRKAYRARHHCDNPGPRTKANYWSCRKW